MPFDDTTLVFKAGGKMFALMALDNKRLNLKCSPDTAIELRERYPFVSAGYHMNKKHWNTIAISDAVPDALVCQWIEDSYKLVVQSLTKKQQMLTFGKVMG
jgi:predicted DNA-binding protein (MmcQ/YjbR family)